MDSYNGKKLFNVSFIDFCSLVCRKRGQKLDINNKAILEHIEQKRCHEYVIKFGNSILEREAGDGK